LSFLRSLQAKSSPFLPADLLLLANNKLSSES